VLSLECARWSELEHAYGNASDIPPLLRQLSSSPRSAGQAEPWLTLWSALAHQGDVYSASFAAVPHVISALAAQPTNADESFFHFPAWVEICRVKQGLVIPIDLEAAYFASLKQLPGLVALAASEQREASFVACALSAAAAALGQHTIAEVILEMESPEVAPEVLEWLHDR
jgi:hypothetical protein